MRIHKHRRFQAPKFAPQVYKANNAITCEEVRVIDEEGNALGVMPTHKAIALAAERELDLIEVSPKAEPPVCKIGDYGQFKYQKEKEARKQRAQSKEVEIKGIRLGLRIGEGDLNIRVQQGAKFFEQGDKIKVEMILRGRERAYQVQAQEVFATYVEKLSVHYPVKIESPVKAQAGKLHMILARQT